MQFFKKKTFIPVVLGFGLFFSACSKEETPEPTDPEGFTTYTIRKGTQNCDNTYQNLQTAAMHFSVKFDSSAVYQTTDPVNQYDINKLYGLADCNTGHHQNSARMGWRWVENRLELHAYGYKNGVRNSEFITAVPIGETVNMSIELNDSTYLFKVGDKFAELQRGCSGAGTGYKLYPYFGGDEMAPQDITIKIKDL